MIGIKAEGMKQVQKMLARHGGKARRALAIAINQTSLAVMRAERKEMKATFKHATPWTLRALAYYQASAKDQVIRGAVYINRPNRMKLHYLEPRVWGSTRRLRGMEEALGLGELIPTKYMRRTASGLMSVGQIRQILSVLGRAERAAGYDANMTARSMRRGKERDYVRITKRWGKIVPGVYQRVAGEGRALNKTARRWMKNKARSYQWGNRGFVTKARGLVPVLLKGRAHKYPADFNFYGVARAVIKRELVRKFRATLGRFLREP